MKKKRYLLLLLLTSIISIYTASITFAWESNYTVSMRPLCFSSYVVLRWVSPPPPPGNNQVFTAGELRWNWPYPGSDSYNVRIDALYYHYDRPSDHISMFSYSNTSPMGSAFGGWPGHPRRDLVTPGHTALESYANSTMPDFDNYICAWMVFTILTPMNIYSPVEISIVRSPVPTRYTFSDDAIHSHDGFRSPGGRPSHTDAGQATNNQRIIH